MILIYVLMANYSPMMAGFVAVMSTAGHESGGQQHPLGDQRPALPAR